MIHPITTADRAADHAEPLYAWQTPDGDLVLLGERHVMAALADDLAAFLHDGTHGEPVSQYDLPGESITIAAAVQEALTHGYSGTPTQAADTIRNACEHGGITGARKDPAGRWLIPKRTLRHWLAQRNR
jgi:hypothetical protein